MRLIQKLRHMEVISKEEYEMLDGLRRVRNQATHEYDLNVPEEDVINYLSLANFVEAKLSEKLVHND
ncbi:DUF4145 domain-containing protein [Pantoea agglomerans]|uniref:DUF4145 domain-containing protein n=1 Tax=Enterobacter agglomerans TaxID=549 RepID=UPI003FD2FD9D